MDTQLKDGGPAFPEHHYFDPSRGMYGMHIKASDIGCGGMSLRDWYAGMALSGFAGRVAMTAADTLDVARLGMFHEIADAMIAARDKKPDEHL